MLKRKRDNVVNSDSVYINNVNNNNNNSMNNSESEEECDSDVLKARIKKLEINSPTTSFIDLNHFHQQLMFSNHNTQEQLNQQIHNTKNNYIQTTNDIYGIHHSQHHLQNNNNNNNNNNIDTEFQQHQQKFIGIENESYMDINYILKVAHLENQKKRSDIGYHDNNININNNS
ncbi:RabGAP/TBC domain-containing protein [Tieghemostelium lacteum]|uniref:RabGAP/TBC domain-containing protein n=1 Tax=Tieghemostelium lacteum TaxID=361077 RepID=A0A151Z4G6_TIELA|nr:RabGAP/TBC domain-containing protein [Tieghemostelium lacteum]|eukprot:KYQ88838.1 RabGAP/TBC domain-containing protein [Tieghemostelium lacteum]